jgi:hypothetical protein
VGGPGGGDSGPQGLLDTPVRLGHRRQVGFGGDDQAGVAKARQGQDVGRIGQLQGELEV